MLVDRARVAAALPGYDLGAELGSGAFGLVLAGRHRALDRPVAIKVLSADHDRAAADFVSEARVLAGISHPHVVQVHDYVEAGALRLIVMELLAGGTLTRRRRHLPPEGACAVGLAVAAALSYAHGRGVLHRDIKADNILFDADGLLKVTDFGIAKIFQGSAATASAVLGTPAYMAPEQITGGRLSPGTDLYALGVVLYQLFSGAFPFDPKLPLRVLWQHHLETVPAPPAGAPVRVADVVMRALAKNPADRHASAEALALDLARAANVSFGSGWTGRSGILLRPDDAVRAAVDFSSAPPPNAAHTTPSSASERSSESPDSEPPLADDEPTGGSYPTPPPLPQYAPPPYAPPPYGPPPTATHWQPGPPGFPGGYRPGRPSLGSVATSAIQRGAGWYIKGLLCLVLFWPVVIVYAGIGLSELRGVTYPEARGARRALIGFALVPVVLFVLLVVLGAATGA